jgi:hypothetical protein
VITACALALCLLGGSLVYLASARQTWRLQPFPLAARWVGWLCLALGAWAWVATAGTAAGLSAALVNLMLVWVCLPYLAWWRGVAR